LPASCSPLCKSISREYDGPTHHPRSDFPRGIQGLDPDLRRSVAHSSLFCMVLLAITKSLSKGPQAYRQQTLSMIAAQELLARGVPLQAGDTIHYVITDAGAAYPPDRARAVAGLDGTWSYDVSAYDNLLLKAALVLLTPLGVTATSLNESTAGC
jgi:hypothetical protein